MPTSEEVMEPVEPVPPIVRVCPAQVDPLTFLACLNWIDDQPLLPRMEPYRLTILREALFTFKDDGRPLYNRILTGRTKKSWKTTDAMLGQGLYKLLAWRAAGSRGNQIYLAATDLDQAKDDIDLCKKIVRANPMLEDEVIIKQNVIERRDGKGFMEILPAKDAAGLHGKTYLALIIDELHTQKTYDLLQALELDRTRPDATQWFCSYASMYRHAGIPLVDLLKQHETHTDPRLYVSWYAGATIEEACPSLNQPLGPTTEDIEDAKRSLPSWIFRRLYLNLPGQPDSAAFDAEQIESAIIPNRLVLPPQPGVSYKAFCDLSGGGADDATLAIAYKDNKGIGVLALLMDQGARVNRTFSPDDTVKKFAPIIKQYGGLSEVTGDAYAAQWPVLAFAKYGITYKPSVLNRSQIYGAFEPLLNSGRVELLDHPKLMQQLIGLVRKGEKIDHVSSEHDDHSNAACGALTLVTQLRQATCRMVKLVGI